MSWEKLHDVAQEIESLINNSLAGPNPDDLAKLEGLVDDAKGIDPRTKQYGDELKAIAAGYFGQPGAGLDQRAAAKQRQDMMQQVSGIRTIAAQLKRTG